MTKETAIAIWDILMEEAGAYPSDRDQFLHYFCNHKCVGPKEFRFCGALGFGGKIWDTSIRAWYVTCYKDDSNKDREAIISRTNNRLQKLYKERMDAVDWLIDLL